MQASRKPVTCLGSSREKERGARKVPTGPAESELDVEDKSGLFSVAGDTSPI